MDRAISLDSSLIALSYIVGSLLALAHRLSVSVHPLTLRNIAFIFLHNYFIYVIIFVLIRLNLSYLYRLILALNGALVSYFAVSAILGISLALGGFTLILSIAELLGFVLLPRIKTNVPHNLLLASAYYLSLAMVEVFVYNHLI